MLRVVGAQGRLGLQVMARLAATGRPVEPFERPQGPAAVGPDDVVVNVADTRPETVQPWAMAGAAAAGYVDASPTERSHRVLADIGLAGAPIVPAAGVQALGDALAVAAGTAMSAPTRVDVSLWVPSTRSVLARATPRERAEIAGAIAGPVEVLVDGQVRQEQVAEDRRLAWFPRPVGPHHAVAVPGSHWRTIPAVLPSVHTVRTALALRSSVAEVVQGIGNLARFDTVSRWMDRWAQRPGADPGTADERWAMVVEVTTDDGGLTRGWAYGHDRHAVTAAVVARVAEALADAPPRPPATRPMGITEVVDATDLLDHLAAVTDLRWSVTR